MACCVILRASAKVIGVEWVDLIAELATQRAMQWHLYKHETLHTRTHNSSLVLAALPCQQQHDVCKYMCCATRCMPMWPECKLALCRSHTLSLLNSCTLKFACKAFTIKSSADSSSSKGSVWS